MCLNINIYLFIYLLLFHDVFYVFVLIFQLETPEAPNMPITVNFFF